jgi:hypothetical protein
MKAVALFAAVMTMPTSSCGRSKGGGIVDNGNHIPAPSPEPAPADPQGTTALTGTAVLKDFTVDLPSDSWRVISDSISPAETIVGDNQERIVFSTEASHVPCAVEPIISSTLTLVYPCSETTTILKLDGTEPVLAEHWERTDSVQRILLSFRRR